MDNSLIISPLVLDSANESIAEPFTMNIGGTEYEVTSRFNAEGKLSVLRQFMTLLLNHDQ